MTFTLQTELANHLEQEIYTKLLTAATAKAERYNKMWAAREEEGKTYHTRKTFHGEEKVYWYAETKGFLTISFYQVEDSAFASVNDYYRPMSCVVNLEACRTNAQQQRDHSVALLEARVNGHLAVTDTITGNNLKLGQANLIEGFVSGVTKNNEEFKVHTQMMWNYRYGENSANGYLTQYVQFRSDRRGAVQEGKSIQQAKIDEVKQAKADAKQAIVDQKKAAKWEKFSKLPVQMEKWLNKQIKETSSWISEEGIATRQAEADKFGWNFDSAWYIKKTNEDISAYNDLKNDCIKWQKDNTQLKALFDKGIDTRNKLKEMYCI